MPLTIHVGPEMGLDASVGPEAGLCAAEGPEVRLVAAEGPETGIVVYLLSCLCAFVPLQGLPSQNSCSAEAPLSTKLLLFFLSLSGAPCGILLVVLNSLDVKCASLICKLCCSHRFEIYGKCSLSTPCSFIAFSAGVLSIWSNAFFRSMCGAKSGMSHTLTFSAAIKVLNAPCSGVAAFSRRLSGRIRIVIKQRYATTFLTVVRHTIDKNL